MIQNVKIEIAHKLGIDVTAEGVETETQYGILKQIGCEFAQGFLFSKPLCYEEAIALVNQDFTSAVTCQESFVGVGRVN